MPYSSYKSKRKMNYDYSQEGSYFITTVVKNRINYFGGIEGNKIFLTQYGEIVRNQWIWLHTRYKYLNLDAYIVMPDHFHGVINIQSSPADAGRTVAAGRDLHLRDTPL